MKKTTVFFLIILAFNYHAFAQTEKVKVKSAKQAMSSTSWSDMPYKASYSSKFTMGSQAYARKVLIAWKAFETGDIDAMNEIFADTLTAISASGDVIKGKANFLDMFKKYRATYQHVSSNVDAWLPFYTVDKNENGMLIWGEDTVTKADGNSIKHAVHEVWLFNKDGKAYYVRSFTAEEPKM